MPLYAHCGSAINTQPRHLFARTPYCSVQIKWRPFVTARVYELLTPERLDGEGVPKEANYTLKGTCFSPDCLYDSFTECSSVHAYNTNDLYRDLTPGAICNV